MAAGAAGAKWQQAAKYYQTAQGGENSNTPPLAHSWHTLRGGIHDGGREKKRLSVQRKDPWKRRVCAGIVPLIISFRTNSKTSNDS